MPDAPGYDIIIYQRERIMIALRRLLIASMFSLCVALPAWADDNPAAKPLNRDLPRHKQFLKIVAKGECRRDLPGR